MEDIVEVGEGDGFGDSAAELAGAVLAPAAVSAETVLDPAAA